MQSRRSFLSSLVAAVVVSPVFCHLAKSLKVVAPESRKAELWEQQSNWDGKLSPYFLAKYGYASKPVHPEIGISYREITASDIADEPKWVDCKIPNLKKSQCS